MRREFEMTQEQLDKILDACKPVVAIAIHLGPLPNQQDNANRAWEALGREMGFDHMTVRPCGKGDRFFTAEEKNPVEVLRDVATDLAEQVGLEVDHAAFDEAGAYTDQPVAGRCAVLRRTTGTIEIHGFKVWQYEHRVVLLDEGQTEEFDEERASRLWLHPYLEDGFHLMEFTNVLVQSPLGCPCGGSPHTVTCPMKEQRY